MTDAFLPPYITLPLASWNGFEKECRVLVKAGEKVSEGQEIASYVMPLSRQSRIEGRSPSRQKGREECFVHSSVPGTVKEMIKVPLANGFRGWCVKIETGGKFTYLGHKARKSTLDVLQLLKEKGVLNTFDSINGPALLSESLADVNTLVVRLGDDDPSVKTTAMLSKLMSNEIKQGAAITASAANAKRVIFAGEEKMQEMYEGNLPDIMPLLPLEKDGKSSFIPSYSSYESIKAEFIPSQFKRYPSAFSSDLYKRIKDLPNEGVLFVDANTMLTVQEAVLDGTPSMTSYVYLGGECLRASALLRVRVGTPIRFLAEQCGSFVKKCHAIVINGFMVGRSAALDTPIDKYVKSVMFVPRPVMRSQDESECISCGNCREVCPEHLLPDVIFMRGTLSGVNKCTGCALCNSVCPSRLPLVQNISRLGVEADK